MVIVKVNITQVRAIKHVNAQKLVILKHFFGMRFILFQKAHKEFARCFQSSLVPDDSTRF